MDVALIVFHSDVPYQILADRFRPVRRYIPTPTHRVTHFPRIQAGNMVRFKELYGDIPGVLVPDVLLAYSARRVITSEWVDGEKVRISLETLELRF